MSEAVYPVQELQYGIRAAFINMPHFRTTSARLMIHAGSMHEEPNTEGAAHFLEHITFQGTEEFPTETELNDYKSENEIFGNAMTTRTQTTYMADGYDIESVARVLTQVAFHPLLEEQDLERERLPIIEEIRPRHHTPYYLPNTEHDKVRRGDNYARSVAGSIESVSALTHENLTAFYRRHYKLGNAVLVVCSNESPEFQHRRFESFLPDAPRKAQWPRMLSTPSFNANGLRASLQQVQMPAGAPTDLSIEFAFPETETPEGGIALSIVAGAMDRLVHQKLRTELGIAYGAQAGANGYANLSFGAEEKWGHVYITTSLDGRRSIQALDAMEGIVLEPLPDNVVIAAMRSLKRSSDHVLQNTPANIADFMVSELSASRPDAVNLNAMNEVLGTLSVDDIQRYYKHLTAQQPLVTATSPSQEVLDEIGAWANA